MSQVEKLVRRFRRVDCDLERLAKRHVALEYQILEAMKSGQLEHYALKGGFAVKVRYPEPVEVLGKMYLGEPHLQVEKARWHRAGRAAK